MNTHLRLGNAAGPLGLRRQDVLAFCIWIAILVASACSAYAQQAPADTTFDADELESFFSQGSKKADPPPPQPSAPRDTAATPVVYQLAPADTATAAAVETAPVETKPLPSADFSRHLAAYEELKLRNGAVTLPVLAAEVHAWAEGRAAAR